MAAVTGVVNQMLRKNLANLNKIPWFQQKNRTFFVWKCQLRGIFYVTARNTARLNYEMSKYYDKYKIFDSTLTYNRKRHFSTAKIRELDELAFHSISDETLNALMEYFEELGDFGYFQEDYDIEYSDGVLTIRLGGNKGTYVINKQTPNRQIWLSSPTSGPKRYDFTESDVWIYRHNGISLHELLSEEISDVIGQSVSFTGLQYGGGSKI